MVFTSAIRQESVADFDKAEAEYHDRCRQALIPASEKLAELESMLKAGIPAKSLQADIAQLKAELQQIYNVTWREHDAHKSTMVELLARSGKGALTLLDPYGSRLASAMASRFKMTAEASWLSMTYRFGGESSFIRSSTSGGATIHALSGSDKPVFQYLSRANQRILKKLADDVASKDKASSLQGHAIILPIPKNVSADRVTNGQAFLGLMVSVFDIGGLGPDQRVNVKFKSDKLRDLWEAFVRTWEPGWINSTNAIQKRMEEPVLLPKCAAVFASKAALVRAIMSDGRMTQKEVTLDERDLEIAAGMAEALLVVSNRLEHLSARSDNAAKARQAKAQKADIAEVPSEDAMAAYVDLCFQAEENLRVWGLPVVPVTQMKDKHREALPAVCKMYETRVKLRNTEECPEPDYLVNEDEGGPFEKGVPNLWFRYLPNGEPARMWAATTRLQFPEWA